MKKFFLLTFAMCVLANMTAQNIGTTTVAFVKSTANNGDNITMKGKITAQIDDDEYIFADKTGSIKLELEDEAEYSLRSAGKIVIGANVELSGIVDKERGDKTKIKVFEIHIIS